MLTKDGILEIVTNSKAKDEKFDLQVLEVLQSSEGMLEFKLSDGEYYETARFPEQHDKLKDCNVITLLEYVITATDDKKEIFVIKFKLKSKEQRVIGSPQSVDDYLREKALSHRDQRTLEANSNHKKNNKNNNSSIKKQSSPLSSSHFPQNENDNYWKIIDITPSSYNSKPLKLKAKVESKALQKFTANTGEQRDIIFILLSDDTGSIKAVAFADLSLSIYDFIQEGVWYLFSDYSVTADNKPSGSNHSKLTLRSLPLLISDDNHHSIPNLPNSQSPIRCTPPSSPLPSSPPVYTVSPPVRDDCNYESIEDIPNLATQTIVNVIGVVVRNDPIEFKIIHGSRMKLRKHLLSDSSNHTILLVDWSSKTAHLKLGDVITLRSAKVGFFKEKFISIVSSTKLHINPNTLRASDLHIWYESLSHTSPRSKDSLSQEELSPSSPSALSPPSPSLSTSSPSSSSSSPIMKSDIPFFEIATPTGKTFSVAQYNILAGDLATTEHFPYVKKYLLNWDERRELLLKNILDLRSVEGKLVDILCMEELNDYWEFFRKKLSKKPFHFDSVFTKRASLHTTSWSGLYKPDGCGIFWNKHKFNLIKEYSINFKDNQDRVAVFVLLEMKADNDYMYYVDSDSYLIVGCTHLHWDRKFEDIQLAELKEIADGFEFMQLWAENHLPSHVVDNYSHNNNNNNQKKRFQIPMIFAGDLNNVPKSNVYRFINSMLDGALRSSFSFYLMNHDAQRDIDQFNDGVSGDFEPPHSSVTCRRSDLIDYIWFSPDSLRLTHLRSIPSKDDLQSESGEPEWGSDPHTFGIPNSVHGSDHIPIMSCFSFK